MKKLLTGAAMALAMAASGAFAGGHANSVKLQLLKPSSRATMWRLRRAFTRKKGSM